MAERKTKKEKTKRTGLGRGLDALIIPSEVDEKDDLIICGIEEVFPNKEQPRKRFDEEKLNDLVASIKEKGIIQPIIVRRLVSDRGNYEIISGERRWRACQKAGLTEISVIVKDVSDRESLELALIENIQREDLNAIEQAEGYKKLIDGFMFTQEVLATSLGKSRVTIANSLRLLKLPDDVKDRVIEGKISEGHARSLLALYNSDDISVVLKKIIDSGLSVRATEALVKKLNTPEKKKKPETKQEQLLHVENELINYYKTKVKIKKHGKKGRIVLEFYSDEDLIRLVELLSK
ncbi:ParB/RepB/Spo0J family partition protein [Thermodesulfobacteriota bacterium]